MEELGRSLRELQDYLNYVIFGVPLYRLALSLLVFFLFLFFRKLFVLILLRSVRKLTRRTATEIDDIVSLPPNSGAGERSCC